MKEMFFLLMAIFCSFTGAYGMDSSKWDLESRVALGQFDAGKSTVKKEMEISLLSLTNITTDKLIEIEVRTDKEGQVSKNQQLAEERGKAVLEALYRLVPATMSVKMEVEVVTKRHDQDGVDLRGAWLTVYKPHQEVIVTEHNQEVIAMKKTNEVIVSTSPTMKDWMLYGAVAVSLLGLLIALMMRRSSKAVAVNSVSFVSTPQPEKVLEVTTSCSSGVDKERLSSLSFYDAEQPMLFNVIAETELELDGVKLLIMCSEKNATGEFKSFHVNADGSIRYILSEKKWRVSVKNTLRQWLYKTADSATDFSVLEEAIRSRLVVIIPT